MFDIEQFLNLDDYATETRVSRRKNSEVNSQEFFTPYSIVKKMCDKIPDEDKSGKIDVKDFLDMNNEDILKENVGKKWDVVLMNPPYDKGLHIKFLKKVSKISNKVVSIQPITWLQKAALFNKNLDDIYCDKLEIIPIDDTAKYFSNTNIRTELGIITIDDKKEINFRNLNLFNESDQDIIYKCIDYTKNNDTLDKYLNKKIGDDLILKFYDGTTLFGNGKITKATFRLCAMNYDLACSKEKTGHIIYLNNIPSEEIRKNIYDFYNSIYLRYWIYKCCLSESHYNHIPFLGFDKFKTKWNESDYEDLFINKIGLTDKEWKYYKEEANKLPR